MTSKRMRWSSCRTFFFALASSQNLTLSSGLQSPVYVDSLVEIGNPLFNFASFQLIRQRLRDVAVSESQKGDAKKAITVANSVDDAPPEEIQAVINQVAVNIHGVYVLKSSPDNPQYDTLRKVVIDLLMAEGPSAKLKKASIVEAAKLQLNRDITDIEFKKVMQELCESKNSAWVLRSGDGSSS